MPLSRVEANAIMAAVKAALAPFVEGTNAPADRKAVQTTMPTSKQPHDPTDPVVKVLPRNWKGDDLRGRRFSECPPNFLGMLAHMLDAFADKNEGDPERQRYAKWDRENAEAARRWRAKHESTRSGQGDLPSVEQLADEGAL